VKLYRILRGPEPTVDDFTSLLLQGRPIPRTAPPTVRRKWGAVSTFTTLELAEKRARENDLGGWWAELEVPDEVEAEEDAPTGLGRHVSLYGATPEQLLGYVRQVGEFDSEEAVK
jgi:hypothetical protein